MTAKIIDGKAYAAQLRQTLTQQIAQLTSQFTPGLAVILVGEDPASQVYVRNKGIQAREVGLRSFEHKLPADTSEEILLRLIQQLNADSAIDGILVQLPLPAHIDSKRVLEQIDPAKDVDGFHPINVGKLSIGEDALIPCTPLGCLLLLRDTLPQLSGLHCVIVGRSNIVGKPMAQLLLQQSCTVTTVHSRTKNPQQLAKQADVLVAAIGKPEFIGADWVKEGATVIDVGINRIERDGKNKLVGDVDFTAVSPLAGAITPVPGGVGPMTIACLLRNTLTAACRLHQVADPNH